MLLNVWKGQRTRNEIRADGHLHGGTIRGGAGVTGRPTGVAVFVAILYEADIFIPWPELSCNGRNEEFMCGIFCIVFSVWTQISLFTKVICHEQRSLRNITHAYQMRSCVFIYVLLSLCFGERKFFFAFTTSVRLSLDTVHLERYMSGTLFWPSLNSKFHCSL